MSQRGTEEPQSIHGTVAAAEQPQSNGRATAEQRQSNGRATAEQQQQSIRYFLVFLRRRHRPVSTGSCDEEGKRGSPSPPPPKKTTTNWADLYFSSSNCSYASHAAVIMQRRVGTDARCVVHEPRRRAVSHTGFCHSREGGRLGDGEGGLGSRDTLVVCSIQFPDPAVNPGTLGRRP